MIRTAAWEKVPTKEELLFFFLDARQAGSFGIHRFTLLRCEGSIFPCLQRCGWRVFSIDGKGPSVGWMIEDGSCLPFSVGRMTGATLLFLGSLFDVLHALAVLVGGLSFLLDRSSL